MGTRATLAVKAMADIGEVWLSINLNLKALTLASCNERHHDLLKAL